MPLYRGNLQGLDAFRHTWFRAYKSGNTTTINGSVDPVDFDTEVFDNGNNYNNSTYIYTVDEDGYYDFEARTRVENIDAANHLARYQIAYDDGGGYVEIDADWFTDTTAISEEHSFGVILRRFILMNGWLVKIRMLTGDTSWTLGGEATGSLTWFSGGKVGNL